MNLPQQPLLRTMMLTGVISTLAIPGISQSWIQLSPLNPPSPTAAPGAYDPATDRMIVFGANNDFGDTNQVWVLTNANGLGGTPQWLQLAPIPDPVNGFPSPRQPWTAYDPVGNRLIIMDGCLGNCLPVATDQWVLSNANGLGGTPAWFKLSPTGGPPGTRVDQVMAYDASTNSMIVFGGQNGCCATPVTYGDVWVLSHANGLGGTPNWTQLSPTGGPPPGQDGVSGVYDAFNNRLVVFGGWPNHTQTATNAVWVLSNANGQGGTPAWTNLVSEGAPSSPPARRSHAAVYDPGSNSMTIFGGYNNGAPYFNDTWILSNANGLGGTPAWTQLSPTGGPPAARQTLAAVFDAVSQRMTIFGGGGASGAFNDTWVLTQCTGPVITGLSATPNSIWPPNHKMIPVHVSGATTGGCGAVSCKIISVSSNEPVDADGDWVITGDLTLNLRAERLGTGTGRTYTITVQCTDASGNNSTKTVAVTVPHDQGER
jgi:hypothetical protein